MDLMRIMALALRFLGFILNIVPIKNRIAFLSRQSSTLSLDMSLLIAELQAASDKPEIEVCLSDPETKKKFAFIIKTLEQLYFACTSRVVIVDGYVPAVCIPKKRKGVTVVQVWHALGAIKKFGYQCLDTPAGRTSKSAIIGRMHRNYDYIIAGGPGAVEAFSEAFNYPSEKIIPLGLPRMDYLLDPSPCSKRREKYKIIKNRYEFLSNGKRTILYAPTLRKGSGYKDWLTTSLKDLAKKYSEEDNFIVMGHPLDFSFDKEILNTYPWVHFISDEKTIDVLEGADIVISDYSAIAFEAGILDKKLIFYTPDLEQYSKSPGLNIEPSKITPEYITSYFEGVGFGSTKRIANFIMSFLSKRIS